VKISQALEFLEDCFDEFGDLDIVNLAYNEEGEVVVEHGFGFNAISVEDLKTKKTRKFVAFVNALVGDDGIIPASAPRGKH
jgi:hypothetical protein